jgi:ADP-ribosyl-[dinitrogen reductase] hydrolase
MTISKRDRYRGAMLGVLAGDAALAEFENKKSAEIADMLSRYGGLTLHDYIEPWQGVRHIEAGHPTDDSELTAALAMSLVECGGFNPANAFMKLRDFIHGNTGEPQVRRSYLTKGKAYGSGGTLRSALKAPTYEQSLIEFEVGNVRMVPTNGALMRCAPIALMTPSVFDVGALAYGQSYLTHRNPGSLVACMAYAVMLHAVIGEQGMLGADTWARSAIQAYAWQEGITPDMEAACDEFLFLDINKKPTEEDIWPHSGGAMISLRVAIWACMNATSYIDGLERIVRLGGDTDTYGAIAGGLLGAHFGIEGIPKDWRDVLIGGDIMIDLADSLYDLAHANSPS